MSAPAIRNLWAVLLAPLTLLPGGTVAAQMPPGPMPVEPGLVEPTSEGEGEFPVGERLEYSVALGPVRLGSVTMRVEAEEVKDGARLLRSSLDISIRAAIMRHEEYLVSWFDPIALRSHAFERRKNSGDRESRRFRFDQEMGLASEISPHEGPADDSTGWTIPRDAVDELAALYLLRRLEIEVGETVNLDRYFARDAAAMRVRRVADRRVRTPAGRFQARVYETVIPALSSFQEKREPTVLVSDDDRRLIVQMETSTGVGRLRLYLTNCAVEPTGD